ncbi:MAG: LssY C-terminal domain-containing protein, partial [Bryobacteraceae bacterium]
NLSSGVSFVVSALFLDPAIAVPILGVKFLIARSPDSEIYFPAGTEMLLQTVSSSDVPAIGDSEGLSPLPPQQIAAIQNLLARLPQQQSRQGNNRSDLVNILLLGTHDQMERAFHAAGWTGEQRHSVLALYRMYHCSVQRMAYRMAPMGALTLNGRAPDSAYQKSLNTFSKRHHIRVWRQRDSDVWLGAATQDVAYMVHRMRLTHATDPLIDNERAKVVNDIWFTGCVDAGSLISRDSLTPIDADGSSILTDGRIAALRLNDCQNPRTPPASAKPEPRPRMRIVQALAVVGNDIARSNPLSLGFNAVRSMVKDSDAQSARFRPSVYGTLAQHKWKRPSVVDPLEEANNPRELTRTGVAGTL